MLSECPSLQPNSQFKIQIKLRCASKHRSMRDALLCVTKPFFNDNLQMITLRAQSKRSPMHLSAKSIPLCETGSLPDLARQSFSKTDLHNVAFTNCVWFHTCQTPVTILSSHTARSHQAAHLHPGLTLKRLEVSRLLFD